MLRTIILYIIISTTYTVSVFSQNTTNCELKLRTGQYSGQTIKLGYYYGTSVFLLDSLKVKDSNGVISHKLYHQGIYILQLPDGNHIEFMTDCSSPVSITLSEKDNLLPEVKGNAIAEGYNIYQKIINKNKRQIDSLKTLSRNSDTQEEKKSFRKQNELSRTSSEERLKELSTKYSGTLLGDFLESSRLVRMVDLEKNEDLSDSLSWKSRIQFYQQHYLDNLVLSNPGLIYTPVLEDKIMKYLNKIAEQDARRKVEHIDQIMQKPMHKEVYRFILEMLYKKLATTLYLPDNEYLFLHLLDQYYLQGKASWIGNKEIKNLSDEYTRRQSAALYQKAPEIALNDFEGNRYELGSETSTYTLLVFWDHSCEHCMLALDDIKKVMVEFSEVDLNIYAVYTGNDLSVWRALIEKKLPKNWIHVAVNENNQVLIDYNIVKLPNLFLLNKNKTIIDKAFTAGQLEDFLKSTRNKK